MHMYIETPFFQLKSWIFSVVFRFACLKCYFARKYFFLEILCFLRLFISSGEIYLYICNKMVADAEKLRVCVVIM